MFKTSPSTAGYFAGAWVDISVRIDHSSPKGQVPTASNTDSVSYTNFCGETLRLKGLEPFLPCPALLQQAGMGAAALTQLLSRRNDSIVERDSP